MLNKPIVTSPAPAFPANLRYIQNGDALNTANHEAQAADMAQALGHLKAGSTSLASQTAPDGTTLIGFDGHLTRPASTLQTLLERMIERTELSDDSATILNADVTLPALNTVYRTATDITADRTITLPVTTAPVPQVGDIIEIHRRQSGTFNHIIVAEGLGTCITLTGSSLNGARFRWDGTSWRVESAYGSYTVSTVG